MNRRSFVKAAALLPLSAGISPLDFAQPGTAKSANPPVPLSAIALADRYQLTLNRVLHGDSPAYTDEFILADVRPTAERRFTEFSGDVSGRYIGALATAAKVYGTDFPHLDALVEKVIALQKPDGSFGAPFHYDKPDDNDLALLWGNGRLLVGLIEYYRLKPSPAVLAASRRLGDFLLKIGPLMLSSEMREAFGAKHFASSYICWMQQTEGLANLYIETKDDRYRKLAEQIAAVIERRPGDHVHGYLTSLRGMVDLYRATGDSALLHQCETAWNDITQSQDALLTGGVPEGWSPNNHRTEGCAEVDWVRLNLALWSATDNIRYVEAAERAIFNEFAFNQFATGDFGHRLYTDTGLPAAGAVRAWWCCTLHGLRCFPDIHANVFRSHHGGLRYDLPLDGHIETAALSAFAKSSLSEDGKVRITITSAAKEPVTLGIRKFSWGQNIQAHVNGAGKFSGLEGAYTAMERVWSVGDVFEVQYDMPLKSNPGSSDRVSFSCGPWLLGASAADNPAYFNEMTADNKLLPPNTPTQTPASHPARPFTVPIAATQTAFLPAEYPDQPASVTLRAIAEQTGLPTTAWELKLLTQNPTPS